MLKQRGHVQRIAGGKGKIRAKDSHVRRRGHGIFVALGGVDGAVLHGAEQFASGHQLVGSVELNDHFPVGGLVKGVNLGFDDVLGQRGPGIGLHAPLDGRLGGPAFYGLQHARGGGHGRRGPHTRLTQKFPSLHVTLLGAS